MKRIFLSFLILNFQFLTAPAEAVQVITDKKNVVTGGNFIPVNPDNIAGPDTAIFRASIQSTSVDWEAVTGLRLREYTITFANTRAAGNVGWEMYYFDEFPCYGSGQFVRTWVNSRNSDGTIRVICLRRPTEVSLAYRVAGKNDGQGRTTGVLRCKVERNLSVKLDECKTESWSDFARD